MSGSPTSAETSSWLKTARFPKGFVAEATWFERLVLAELLGDRSAIDVDRKHQEIFTKAIGQLKKSLVKEFEGDLFRPNRRWFFTGMAISVCAVLLALFVGG
jgi:hypothetical protein